MADVSTDHEKTKKMIILMSSDGCEFPVPKKIAMMIRMIRHAIEDGDHDTINSIPIPNVNREILTLMLEYCTKHATYETKTVSAAEELQTEELEAWDKNFVDVDGDTLYVIITTAQFLGIDGLFDLACKKVLEVIRTKPVNEVRRFFKLESSGGFTPEEQAKMNRAWAFEH